MQKVGINYIELNIYDREYLIDTRIFRSKLKAEKAAEEYKNKGFKTTINEVSI